MPTAIPNSIATRGRMESIDVLRGVAALSVFFSHSWPPGGEVVEGLRLWVLCNGQAGVLLFFMISGYVVPGSLLGHQNANLRRFVVSRVARLYPAYWVSLGMVAILAATAEMPSPGVFAANVTMLQRFVGQPDIQGVYWTLAVELMFYALVAVLFVLRIVGNPQRMGWLVLGLSLSLVAGALLRRLGGPALPVGTGLYLLLMLFGAWIRVAAPSPMRLMTATIGILGVLVICCWLLYAPHAFGRSWQSHLSGFVVGVLSFILLWNRPWLRWRPLVWAGAISYPVYLFHVILTGLTIRHWPDGDPYLRFLLGVALTLALAALVHLAVEKPSIRLGRHIAEQWAQRTMNGQAAQGGQK